MTRPDEPSIYFASFIEIWEENWGWEKGKEAIDRLFYKVYISDLLAKRAKSYFPFKGGSDAGEQGENVTEDEGV